MARNGFGPIVISHASNHLCSLIVAMFFARCRNKYNNQIISLTKYYPIWKWNRVSCPRCKPKCRNISEGNQNPCGVDAIVLKTLTEIELVPQERHSLHILSLPGFSGSYKLVQDISRNNWFYWGRPSQLNYLNTTLRHDLACLANGKHVIRHWEDSEIPSHPVCKAIGQTQYHPSLPAPYPLHTHWGFEARMHCGKQ